EAIKKNFEISKVLDHYQVKKANSEGSYHCPFHDDKTPSFVAKSGQDYWKCLSGCGNGDQIDFIAKFESINKKQAINKLRQLADEFNIENKTPKENKKTDKKE